MTTLAQPQAAFFFIRAEEILRQHPTARPQQPSITCGRCFDVCSYLVDTADYTVPHNGMNVAMVDGHVKFLPLSKLQSLGTAGIPFAGYSNGVFTGWHNNGDTDEETNQ